MVPFFMLVLNTQLSLSFAEFTESDHYITVRSNGGLNQMRTGVCETKPGTI